jgi:hypothetical protein
VAKTEYYLLLQDPRWQKKRLEVLELSGSEKSARLEVHHSYYERGLMPWEYPSESLHCLCTNCHKEAQANKELLNRQLGRIGCFSDLDRLIGYAMALECQNEGDGVFQVGNYETARGIADAFGLAAKEVIDLVKDNKVNSSELAYLRKAKKVTTSHA